MPQTKEQKAVANKIKKWLKTAEETKTETRYFGLPITRLTSIKSLGTSKNSNYTHGVSFLSNFLEKLNGM